MRKITTVLLIILMLCNSVGYALALQTENNVVLKGKDNSTDGQNVVTIDVYAPGKTYNDFTGAEKSEYLDILVYRSQGVTNEKGEYEFSFDINTTGGEYSAVVFCENWNETKTETFRFVNPREAREYIALLNDVVLENDENKTEADIILEVKSFISSNCDKLGFCSECDIFANKELAAEFIYNEIKKAPLDEADYTKAIDLYKLYAVISSVDNNMFLNIFNYENDVLFKETELEDIYNKPFITENIQKNITSDLKNKGFVDKASFYKALKEAFVLRVTENPDGVDNLKLVYSKLEDFIGIDADNTAGYDNVINKSFASTADLKKAFNTTSQTPGNPGSNGGGGGGGGGASFNRNPSTFSDVAVTPPFDSGNISPVKVFSDLDGVEWAKEYIYKLVEKKVVDGISDTEFAPNSNITREAFTKMIVNAFLENPQSADINFADVDKNMWYFDFIAKAYNSGIIKGISDDTFGIGRPITRQDMATIAYRAYLIKNKNIDYSAEEKFDDDNMIDSYAKEAVYAMKKLGIISGVDKANFAPVNYATRAEAAKIIAMLISL